MINVLLICVLLWCNLYTFDVTKYIHFVQSFDYNLVVMMQTKFRKKPSKSSSGVYDDLKKQ